MNSIGFLELLLQYYLPGLDISSLTEEEFALKVGWLLRIRKMERADNIDNVFKALFGEQ